MTLLRLIDEWSRGHGTDLAAYMGPAGGGEFFCRWVLRAICGDETIIEADSQGPATVFRAIDTPFEVWDSPHDGMLQEAARRSGRRRVIVLRESGSLARSSNSSWSSLRADVLDIRDDFVVMLIDAGIPETTAANLARLFSPATQIADELSARLQPLPVDVSEYLRQSPILHALLRKVSTSDSRVLELGRILLLLEPQEIELSDEWPKLATALCGHDCSVADASRALLDYPWLFDVRPRDGRDFVRPRNPLATSLLAGLIATSGSEHYALYNALRTRAQAALISTDSSDAFVANQLPRQAMASFAIEDLFKDAVSVLCSDPTALVREIEQNPSLVLNPGAKAVLLCSHRLQDAVSPASSLELCALRVGLSDFASAIGRLLPNRPWRAVWARAQPVHANRIVFHQPAPALAFATAASFSCGVVGTSDGSAWMTSAYERPIRLWGDQTVAGEVRAVGLYESPSGRRIAALATSDQKVVVVDCQSGEELWANSTDHEAPLSALAIGDAAEAPLLVTSGVDGILRVVDLFSGASLTAPTPHYCYRASGRAVEVRCLQLIQTDSGWRLLFGAVDGAVGLVDPLRGVLLDRQVVTTAVLNGMSAVASDNEILIAVGASDGSVYALTMSNNANASEEPKHPRVIARHRASVNGVSLTQWEDGLTCLAASSDGTWSLNRFDGSYCSEKIEGHFGPVWSIGRLRSRNADLVATVGGDGCCRVWVPEAVTRESLLLEKPTRHSGSVTAVVITDANSELIVWTGGADGELRVWSAEGTITGRPLARNQVAIRALVVNDPDETGSVRVFSGSARGELYITDSRRGQVIRQVLLGIAHDGITSLVSARVKGREVLVSGGVDGATTLWDIETEKPTGTITAARHGAVTAMCLIETRGEVPLIVAGGQDGVLTFRRADGLEELWRSEFDGPVMAMTSLPFHSAGLVVGLGSGAIYFTRDARRGAEQWVLLGRHNADVTGLSAFIIGGRLVVASSSLDRHVRLWDLSTRLVLQQIELDGLALALSAATPYVAVATTAGAAVFAFNEDPLLLALRSQ